MVKFIVANWAVVIPWLVVTLYFIADILILLIPSTEAQGLLHQIKMSLGKKAGIVENDAPKT